MGPEGWALRGLQEIQQPRIAARSRGRIYLPLRTAKGKRALNVKGNFKWSTFRAGEGAGTF